MNGLQIAAIIPARMGSTRFPGKPLLNLFGLPMIEHVRRRTALCRRFSDVIVATCDEPIAAVVRQHGGRVVMTSPTHPAASDRVAEAMRTLDCTHVVNVQGDELLVLPSDLERMVNAMEHEPEVPAWNAVGRLERAEELADRSIVKCAISRSGRILWCARDLSLLPLGSGYEPIRRVLGILGYRRDALERYVTLDRTPLEIAESIDQWRIIEHDVPLRSVPFQGSYPGINEPREVDVVRAWLSSDPLQQAVLAATLQPGPHDPTVAHVMKVGEIE